MCLDGLAAVTAAAGDAARSARLSGAATALEDSLNVAPIFKHHRERYVIAARARLGDAAWVAAEAAGRALPLESIIAEALGLADDAAVPPNGRTSRK